MIIKTATEWSVVISMPDALIHYLQSLSNLPAKHHHSHNTDAKAESLRNPVWRSLHASRVQLPFITPYCLPIHATLPTDSASQPPTTYKLLSCMLKMAKKYLSPSGRDPYILLFIYFFYKKDFILMENVISNNKAIIWFEGCWWLIHVNVWQKPLQYCKVSLQLIKINGKKNLKNTESLRKNGWLW